MAKYLKKENTAQKAILDYLALKKHFFWRNNSGAMKTASGHLYFFGAVGSPDIFVLFKGILYGLEVKAPKGKQSPNQIEFQKNMEKNGGVYKVCFSLDEVIGLGL